MEDRADRVRSGRQADAWDVASEKKPHFGGFGANDSSAARRWIASTLILVRYAEGVTAAH